MRSIISKYAQRVGITCSVGLNVIVFGGPSNQTFSARNHIWQKEGKPNIVFLIDSTFYVFTGYDNHCMDSWVYWYIRKHRMNCKELDYYDWD